MTTRHSALPAPAFLALLACLCALPFPAMAESPLGLWTGRLVADRGSCDDETRDTSTFQIETRHITFTPADGSILLTGVPEKGYAHYHAEALIQQPSGAPFPMVFEAHPEGRTIVGTYGTPRCRAHIVLKR
ncbi:hypothetical protein CFR78_12745 [Komagataeibacter rhaeticus]|uniref:Uncharacterized protein n=1 Tax=Komagataeibacter rhaeticus TaxID=215221 RepID=A0A181CBQ9_9PROT|nr:hypothetical protein [Komagataeibacter rhaeticus]ATU72365.1 hypothetical protein CT154_05455 [Komagataeibacter xylinus]KDU96832.1 hypothetical protein GLUCORHAEAF1_19020 [Komagataeibacter rhaeticus AF1]MBL7240225.1 hypothetical protein [Komagataeibacter rhaeticus]MDT8872561.1 hypothetical protein [Komagataeibacter rhaeticus]PYD52769.1 hypothetical protein CFR78_12745 [Komagataeibacter rhaeticus]